jgi:signal transduction histidine kinase
MNFGAEVYEFVKSRAEHEYRKIALTFDLEQADLFIPSHVLQAIMEGLVRNAIEAVPDGGTVTVTGRASGDRYIFKVKDTGVGIPDKDKERIFEGFYPVQDTEDYASRRPYSFNAGGKGIDLLRIRMFAELYGFRVSFVSQRCPRLVAAEKEGHGVVETCMQCKASGECPNSGGSEFVIDFPLADCKPSSELYPGRSRVDSALTNEEAVA